MIASKATTEDLITAKEKGISVLTALVQDRLITNDTGFFDRIPKLKLGTFSACTKRKYLITKGENVVLHADRNLFAGLLVVGQSGKMDTRTWTTSMVFGCIRWYTGFITYNQAFNLCLFQAYGVDEKHDIYLCREIIVVEPFQFKWY